MTKRQDTLQQYVSDMLAVERHILQPLESQNQSESFAKYPAARLLVGRIEAAAQAHILRLEQRLVGGLGGEAGSAVKSAITTVLGAAAGVIDKARTNPVSKDLRDDYTALNLAAVGYTMLHTTGLALRDDATAGLALDFLKDYTPLLAEINEILPAVVVAELHDESEFVDADVAVEAVRNTQAAWTGEHIHSGHTHDW